MGMNHLRVLFGDFRRRKKNKIRLVWHRGNLGAGFLHRATSVCFHLKGYTDYRQDGDESIPDLVVRGRSNQRAFRSAYICQSRYQLF